MAYQLKHIIGNSYMLEGMVNLGLYHRGGGSCTLIDSGIDEDTGKRVLNLLKQEGFEVDSIINTHSHADHIGGNAVIQKRTGCSIYASPIEAAIIENPLLEPLYLFSAAPPDFLQNKFVMTKPSKVTETIQGETLVIDATPFEILQLPGHSLGHIGIATPDGVLYAGDAYFSQNILEKHGFPFFQDITSTLETLNLLRDTSYSFYLPCHGELTDGIEEIIQGNIRIIEEVIRRIMGSFIEPKSTEELIQEIYKSYHIPRKAGQYYLTWATLSGYLAHLNNKGYIESKFYMHQLKWQRRSK